MADQAGSRKPIPASLANRLLLGLLLAGVLVLVAYFSALPWLPAAWKTPGSPPLYALGVAGGASLLVSMGFVAAKRSARAGPPPAWLRVHVVAAMLGTVLVAIHSAGSLGRPPALLFLVLIALAMLGVWARTRVSRQMSGTFATRYENFAPPHPFITERLGQFIAAKTRLLESLDPAASEGTFALTPAHWLRRPWRAFCYNRLARSETRLIGARKSLPAIQAHWRRMHILLGLLLLLGVAAHIFAVTFFAGYVADGREITWPHFSAW